MSPNRVKLNISKEDSIGSFSTTEEQKSQETNLKPKPKPFLKSKGVTFTENPPNNLLPGTNGQSKIRKLST